MARCCLKFPFPQCGEEEEGVWEGASAAIVESLASQTVRVSPDPLSTPSRRLPPLPSRPPPPTAERVRERERDPLGFVPSRTGRLGKGRRRLHCGTVEGREGWRRAGRKDGGGHTHTRAESGARNCSTGLNSVADGRTRRAPFQHKYCWLFCNVIANARVNIYSVAKQWIKTVTLVCWHVLYMERGRSLKGRTTHTYSATVQYSAMLNSCPYCV